MAERITIPDEATLLAHATEFRFPLYPEGHEHWDIAELAVTVEWRGEDKWAVVVRHSWCVDANGERKYESIPSDREDEFKARFRFARDEAIRIACDVAVPKERARWDALLARKARAASLRSERDTRD